MDILRILDDLNYYAVEKPRKVLGLPVVVGLDQDEISMQIAKVRASLPTELKQAVQTVRESDRIVESAREDANATLDNAKKEAERILEQARQQSELIVAQAKAEQERMIAESEVLKLSKAQAEEIRQEAEREATQLKRRADKYAFDVMNHVETVLGKLMAQTERSKQEVAPKEAPAAPREKIRV